MRFLPQPPQPGAAHPRVWRALRTLGFGLGFSSFGGPAGQIAIVHTALVERRRWISEQRFLHALNRCLRWVAGTAAPAAAPSAAAAVAPKGSAARAAA